MAVINRVLNILILILAIVALTFGYLLASHRQQAKDRADKYAEKLAAVAVTLDTNTGTSVKADVTKDKLAWKSYRTDAAGVDKALTSLTAAATGVQKQRDDLGAAVADLNATLGGEEVKATELQNAKTYVAKVDAVKASAKLIGERDQKLAADLETLAAKIGVDVKKGDLSSTVADTYNAPLKSISDKAVKQYDNNNKMKTSLAFLIEKLDKANGGKLGFRPDDVETQPEDKVQKLYEAADTVVQEAAASNALKKRVDELAAQKKEIEDKYSDTTNSKSELEIKVAALNAKIAELSKPGAVAAAAPTESGPKMFDGKIVKVNYDWNYIIVDLGAKDGLPSNVDLVISRGGLYLGTAHVNAIYTNYAVADIVPKVTKGAMLEGDRAFYQVAAAMTPTTAASLNLVPATATPAPAPAAPAATPAETPREVIGVGLGMKK